MLLMCPNSTYSFRVTRNFLESRKRRSEHLFDLQSDESGARRFALYIEARQSGVSNCNTDQER